MNIATQEREVHHWKIEIITCIINL